jgi:hypothetical protein
MINPKNGKFSRLAAVSHMTGNDAFTGHKKHNHLTGKFNQYP